MSPPRRIATAWLPAPVLQVAARARPDLQGCAVVAAAAHGGSARVAACSKRARAAGIRDGQTLAQARARCGDLVVVEPDEAELAALRREVVEALTAVAPGVEWSGGGCFHLDASGVRALHGSERALLVGCWQALTSRRLVARVGCAGTRLASRLAARTGRGFRVVPPGGDAAFLAPLPLSRLSLRRDVLERLDLLGVRTLGAFAALPAAGLAARFGSDVVAAQRLARGEESDPLCAEAAEAPASAAIDLDEPVSGLEPVTFLLKGLAERLVEILTERGTGVSVLELRATFDRPADGGGEGDGRTPPPDVRRVRPSRPLTGARAVLDLCRVEIEARPVAGWISSLALVARAEETVRFDTRELFGAGADPAALAAAVDRLRTLLGPDAVVTPRPRRAWRRERRRGWSPFDPAESGRARPRTARGAEALDPADVDGEMAALPPSERLLDRPVPIHLRLPDDENGARGLMLVPPAAEALGELPEEVAIVAAHGPWRVAGDWWRPTGASALGRDEHLLLGADGGIYRVLHEIDSDRWLLAGCLD